MYYSRSSGLIDRTTATRTESATQTDRQAETAGPGLCVVVIQQRDSRRGATTGRRRANDDRLPISIYDATTATGVDE